MGEALGILDEALEEQGRDHRASIGTFGDVIDVGNLALEQFVVRRPEGHAP
ncbi:hypothetical protein D3C83_209470 [compost metagenome]